MSGVNVPPQPHRRHAASPGGAAAWWVLALCLVYVAYFGLLAFFEIWGLERLEWRPDPGDRSPAVISAVRKGSAAERAGLRAGDRVLAVDGRPVCDILDWHVVLSGLRPGRPVELRVGREAASTVATLVPAWTAAGDVDVRGVLIVLSFQLPSLVMALVLVWRRPSDISALVGAWLLATLATATDVPRDGMGGLWRSLPGPVAALLWVPYVGGLGWSGPILLTFAGLFPRPLVRRPRDWLLVWLPGFAVLAWLSPVLARAAMEGRTTAGDLQHVLRIAPVNALYVLAGVATLVVGYRRLGDRNEKRRVRVLVAGAALALLAPLPLTVMQALDFSATRPLSVAAQAVSLLVVIFPFAFAYAVLRHHLFDLRLVVRAGLRYALARRTLLALVPILAGILVLDLLRQGDRPLLAVLAERGLLYSVLAALALVARARRDQWLDALDRRFFRERYDALRLLREVVGEVDRGSSLADAAPRVVAAIHAAVHSEFVALFVEEAGEEPLRAVAVAPVGREVPGWPVGSRFLGVLQALGAPLEVTSARAAGLLEDLPAEDQERLERGGYHLAVPVLAPGRKAFLALGPKRSGEPWDREEREMLATVAASLGLLLRRETSAETPALSPPVFRHERYQIERPLGSGGMGVVYEATDRELERRVAIKLLREDRTPRADDAERFRREARALAAFSHPNVVTIHDFGVGRDGRSFLVMEFLTGPTLRGLLRQEGWLSIPRALEILGGVAAAVEAAHRLGIVHRDLKPENVILAPGEAAEVPKVLDFGLARLRPAEDGSEAETATRALAGTPRYMAPEQLCGGAVEPSWDVWALSVIAYEMLTGVHPFQGAGTGNGRAAALAGRVLPVSLPSSGAAPALDAFFSRALAVEKKDRPSSPGEMLGRLREALADRSRPV